MCLLAKSYSGPRHYFFTLKMEIRAVIAGMATINLLVPDLLPERVAINGSNLVDETILAASIMADVIIHFIPVEFPTERRYMASIG
jgi:hypothetical protein